MTDQDQMARQAATVIIVRDRPDRPSDLLMTERASTMAFAAGAMVFPGGAVDEADRAFAATLDHGLDPDEAAARIAAIRETLEECGLAVGLAGPLDAAIVADLRVALAQGASLADLLATRAISVDLDALLPFSRWRPAVAERVRRVYDTRFYLARAPEGQEASADANETVHLIWESAAGLLARNDAGELHVIFPTRRNLERLALFDCFDALAAHAASIPIEQVRPWREDRDGETYLCIPTHLGYPITAERMTRAKRG